jgi:integrase
MLTVYRRHRETCAHKADRISKKCRCSLWAKGTLEGKPYQKSLKTRSFERAWQLVKNLEDGTAEKARNRVTIAQAVSKFVADCEARDLNKSTMGKYKRLSEALKAFAEYHGISSLDDLPPDKVREFRNAWPLSPRTAAKELERLRAFFRFCQENEWIGNNPAKVIKAPQVKVNPRIPFEESEIRKILEKANDDRERTFVLTLRHTGLRIGDASLLRTEHFQDNRIFLYTTKAGTPVSVVIPPSLVALLKSLKPVAGYFFLRGESTYMHTTANTWRRTIKRMCKDAGVYPDHPHRFRHTLAADLLVKGASVEDVAAILGNSPQIVQKHYSQFIKARQDRLDSIVAQTWKPAIVRMK